MSGPFRATQRAQPSISAAPGHAPLPMPAEARPDARARPWWSRADLRHVDGRLRLGDLDVQQCVEAVGTPAFLYRVPRVHEKVGLLYAAGERAGIDLRVLYAIKANRHPGLLTELRLAQRCGLDLCSPGELRLALGLGYPQRQLSYTAAALTDADARLLAALPEVRVNCDSISAIRRLGRFAPGRAIGLRINPAVGVSYADDERLNYATGRPTKFGIYSEHLAEALAAVEASGLRVDAMHFHVGCGCLNEQLDALNLVFERCVHFAQRFPPLQLINIGGGLGVPHRETDAALDLDAWVEVVARHFGRFQVPIVVEPGDFLVKDAGMLVLRVVHVERRLGTTFVTLDGGFQLAVEPAFYDLPCAPVPVLPRADRQPVPVTVAGNINEALDLFARGVSMPPPEEGDLVALLNAGGYAASMSSNHCARGGFSELLVTA